MTDGLSQSTLGLQICPGPWGILGTGGGGIEDWGRERGGACAYDRVRECACVCVSVDSGGLQNLDTKGVPGATRDDDDVNVLAQGSGHHYHYIYIHIYIYCYLYV